MVGPIVLQALVAMGQTHEATQVYYTSSDCSGSPALANPASTVTSANGCFLTGGYSAKLSCDGSVTMTTYMSQDCTSTLPAVVQAAMAVTQAGQSRKFSRLLLRFSGTVFSLRPCPRLRGVRLLH